MLCATAETLIADVIGDERVDSSESCGQCFAVRGYA